MAIAAGSGMAVATSAGEPNLAGLGGVPGGYRHDDRLATPGDDLVLPGARLKWYGLRPVGTEVPEALERAARDLLAAEAAAGVLGLGYGLGFVVLHASDPLAYLIVGAWRDNQELWEALYVRDPRRGEGFRRAKPGEDAPTLCVWELAPVWHEREAWVRFLRSERDEAAKRAWLADRLSGMV